MDFEHSPEAVPDPAAEKWLGAGPVLRNSTTGEVFGPPLQETRPKGGYTLGPEEQRVVWLIRALWIFSAAFLFFSAGRSGHHDDVIGAIALSVVFLPVCFFLQGFLMSDLKTRCIAGYGIAVGLLLLHVPLLIVLAQIGVTSYAIYGYYRSPRMINFQLRKKGYSRQTAIPGDFSGRLASGNGDQRWKDGKPIGRFHFQYAEDPKNPGRVTHEILQTFYEPYATPEFPYGWVRDLSVEGGYVPRQSDPMQSPVPKPMDYEDNPDVFGGNKPLSDDDLNEMGAMHPMK